MIKLYRNLNLHPLALSLINRAEKEANIALKNEKEKTEKEWLRIARRIAAIRGKDSFILGNKISDVKDWGKVKIIRPSDSYWIPSDKK